ncbi:MAG: TetR/AcrR family transcriptional regulator [Ilumatobacter sp.]|uniref:TetR/AcrR family transcriptional regulator n=1 Tax=Ilumatobacter sp. TaxID=1967498 RepID=UPI0026040FBD|nr:TetR/AcrR family transcriptional regulator [Ilumatobacter sp.]MDJ0768211.1 TetR/AcrR family transcriptional regulator [Ilumatobacter sp.]
MVVKKRSGATAERFVDVTLELIEEQGGSQNLSLREVARRVGCAPTNVYNYFDGLPGLLWEALRRAVIHYAHAVANGLDDDAPPLDFLRHVVANLITYAREHPGLYRFISWDPINDGTYSDEVIQTVVALNEWFVDVIVACAPETDRDVAQNAFYVIDAYISGESANLVTNRALPGADIATRMLDNALRLFTSLTAYDESSAQTPKSYPRLEVLGDSERVATAVSSKGVAAEIS